jgi:hypothetical protein
MQNIAYWRALGMPLRFVVELTVSSCTTTLAVNDWDMLCLWKVERQGKHGADDCQCSAGSIVTYIQTSFTVPTF